MSRYIDAELLKVDIRKAFPSLQARTEINIVVNSQPSIDIVRCKECKYFIDNLTDNDTDEAYGECCFDWDIKMPTADDFCSYGEREGE